MQTQHVLRENDAVVWAKRPHLLYRVLHLHYDGQATVEVIGDAWVRWINVPIAELKLAPVDLEELN